MTPAHALDLVRAAATDGRLAALAGRHGVEVVTVYGSALSSPHPTDLDLAVGFGRGVTVDLVGVVTDLMDLLGDDIDVMDVDRAHPVAARNALVGCELVYESPPGAFARRQMRAITMALDVQPLLDRQLDLLASR